MACSARRGSGGGLGGILPRPGGPRGRARDERGRPRRRPERLRADPASAPDGGGVLVIDDSGDRKDGTKSAHVGRQWLGRYGKNDNGVVTVTTVWADERVYYPVHAVPYTPARHFGKGKNDPEFRTKLAIGADLAARARAAGFAFRAVVAGCA